MESKLTRIVLRCIFLRIGLIGFYDRKTVRKFDTTIMSFKVRAVEVECYILYLW